MLAKLNFCSVEQARRMMRFCAAAWVPTSGGCSRTNIELVFKEGERTIAEDKNGRKESRRNRSKERKRK
jgi:hypothetical protein